DGLLKVADALALDLLAFRLAFLALDPELVLLRDVVLLGLAVDGGDDGRRQLDPGHQDVVEDDGIPHRDAVRLFALVLHHLLGEPVLHEFANFILNFLARRRIDLFGRVLRDYLAGEAADSGLNQHLLVIRPDRLVQHGDGIALQAVPHDDRCRQVHAVAGDGVVGFGEGLQPQVVQKNAVPGRNEIEALVLEEPRVQHRALAETLPQNTDVAAGDGATLMGGRQPPTRGCAPAKRRQRWGRGGGRPPPSPFGAWGEPAPRPLAKDPLSSCSPRWPAPKPPFFEPQSGSGNPSRQYDAG